MTPLTGVLIGCGYISERQLTAWQQIETAQMLAVCDLEEEKARRRAQQFGIPHVYTSVEVMLDEQRPDFVDIATRPGTHRHLVQLAADHGIQVLCQKPIADSMEEAKAIVAICERAGVTLMVNENARHQPWFRKSKALIEAGALGDLFYARFGTRNRGSMTTPQFPAQPYFVEMPRLMVYEMDVHFLDTARYLFGEASRLYARTHRISPHIAGEDFALIVVDFEDLTCVVDSSWGSVPTPRQGVTWGPFQVEGDQGTLVLGSDGVLTLYTDDGEQSWPFPQDSIVLSFVATQRHFIDCLRQGQEPETSGRATLKTLALVFAAYRSAETHNAVAMDPAEAL